VRFFYLDASALAKRYTPETGTALIDQIFAGAGLDRLYVFNVGIAEIVSVFVRKKNAGQLPAAAFTQALVNFGAEILSSTKVRVVDADSVLVVSALPLIEKHSLNATDAILLRSSLNLNADHRVGGDALVVVACDQRLLRAAQTEGLETFDPEKQGQSELVDLLRP
jgi:predicted nucleic acid-binding protein